MVNSTLRHHSEFRKRQNQDRKQRIIVLDDIITSLDSANRVLVVLHLLELFGDDVQKVFLTHNASFFNLSKYIFENSSTNKNKWTYLSLYEFRGKHVLYKYTGIETIKKIEEDYKREQNSNSPNLQSIGNRLRQKFEVLIYELSKLLQIGTHEELKNILSRLLDEDTNHIYLFSEGSHEYNVYDLVRRIYNKIYNNSIDPSRLRELLKEDFEEFNSKNELKHLIPIMRDLKIFQKLVLHQMSHGNDTMPTYSPKEIEYTIILLKKMERVIGMNKESGASIYIV